MSKTMQYSDFVTTRLSSQSNTQVILGLSVIYFSEFLKVHLGPVLYSGLNVIIKLLLPTWGNVKDPTKDVTNKTLDEVVEERSIDLKEKYKTSAEDKKSSKGNENDVYMLKTHGYNKYRFVSKAFIKRNKLVNTEDS